jgi:uncharacterized repeat protein (TIGR01451 family)
VVATWATEGKETVNPLRIRLGAGLLGCSSVFVVLVLLLSASAPASDQRPARAGAMRASSATATAAAPVPRVSSAAAFGVSKPVRNITPPQSAPQVPLEAELEEEGSLIHPAGDGSYHGPDPALQQVSAGIAIPPAGQNFEGNDIGESSSDGVFVGAPPDTNGDVGPNHYVQSVNTVFSVYSKSGARLAGPIALNQLWKSAPNGAQFNCTTQSRGDPVVQYDAMADRWLISQFNFPGEAVIAPPFDECVAISQTADPTGAYFLYDFRYSTTVFNDYPHFGVWPDAYYMSVNQFDGIDQDHPFLGAGACAFERGQMLTGNPSARQVCFDEGPSDPGAATGNYVYGGQLPTDLDGAGFGSGFTGAPPAGAPNPFFQFIDSTTAGQDRLLQFKFHVDWANPASSTFSAPTSIPVADFSSNLCAYNDPGNAAPRNCLAQKDSPDGLDPIPDRLMYRVAYRNFGSYDAIVLNHTVDIGDAAKHAGIRWYELRDPTGSPSVSQQSTYAPDAESRWMGSAAMDQNGNIALGYSLSSGNRYPAIAYTARRAGDPAGQMTLGEGLLYQGLGSQTGTDSRWGDYSSMSVDPNGCTFWYTQEHYLGTGEFNWGTRIGSFTLPNCGDPQISMTSSSPLVRVRGDFTYTIGVTTGQSPVQGAVVSDTLPGGLSLLSVTPSTGSCQVTTKISCYLGDLPAGDLETISLEVHAQSVGNPTNTATLSTSSIDPNPANNSASVTIEVFDSCVAPGAVMATDPTGDQTGTAQQDLTSVAVAEPYFAPSTNRLVFTLKTQNLSTLPPNAYWYEHFSYGGVNWFVDMETATNPVTPTFHYGFFAVDETTGINTENELGTPDSGTFNANGTITIGLDPAKLDPASAAIGPPTPGSVLAGVHGETRTLVGALLLLNDTTSGRGYTLSGNDYCAPNTPPTARLSAAPTSGSTGVTVNFNGSASSDPDPGDAVASYTFRFGDGTAPVTQPGATISHPYTSAGTFHATLTVRDRRGQESTNVAAQDITVTTPSGADLSVVKTGPAKGKVGQSMTYTIAVTNSGPSAATGVTVTDRLPKNAGVGTVASSQGTCAPRPKEQTVVCSIGSMTSAAKVTITLVVKPTQKGPYTDTATVAATSPADPAPGNNTSSVTTTVSS